MGQKNNPFQKDTSMVKGNGQRDFQEEIEGVLSDAEFPSMIKEFVHPGDDVKQLLMRTFIKNERQATAVARYLSLCREFNYKRGEEKVLLKLAANCSIDSMHIKML